MCVCTRVVLAARQRGSATSALLVLASPIHNVATPLLGLGPLYRSSANHRICMSACTHTFNSQHITAVKMGHTPGSDIPYVSNQ